MNLKPYIGIMTLVVSFLLLSNPIAFARIAPDKITITGTVIDKETKAPLIGAAVYIPDLKTGTSTDADGNFTLENLPQIKLLFEVRYLGYKTLTQAVDLTKSTSITFEMEASSVELGGVQVTASPFSSDNSRNSISVSTLSDKDLRITDASNIINAVAKIPGVSAITTGGAISKPVIRGLGYNHVITLIDGVRQEGNQWGDEHGIEVDQFSVERVEVLKGPASLLYGSDAMGGVLNLLPPQTIPVGTIRGEASTFYATNNGLTASSLSLEGNQKGFLFNLRGSYKNAAAIQTPDEYLYNTGFNEKNISGMVGLNRSWGYTHLLFSRFDSEIGFNEGNRDSLSGRFINEEGNIIPDNILKGRDLQLPFQNVSHNKITSLNNFIIGNSQLKVNVGFQTNDRKEFEESADQPGLFLRTNTITYDAKIQLGQNANLEPVFGVSGMTQINNNKGQEFLIPDYHLQDVGVFAYLKRNFEKLSINGGARFDNRSIDSKQLEEASEVRFKAFNTNISAVSASLGGTYEISKVLNAKLNIGRGFRAPNIAELASNGVHEGTVQYEIGNPNLKAETSLQFDGELSAQTKHVFLSLNGYYNLINNFIYKRNFDGEQKAVDGALYEAYRYVQGNSILTGFEVIADFHPVDALHFENRLSYVRGTNEDTNEPLPFIPPFHASHDLRWDFKTSSKTFVGPYVKIGVNFYAKQDRIDPAFETPTNGYALLDAGLGTQIKLGKQLATFYIVGNNLTNRTYYDHMSRWKYLGLHNMGRNITFGLNVPFGLKTSL